MEDHEIYDLYWKRDEEAITQTHMKYGPWCRGIAMRILAVQEDAEECVNDTYMTVWNNIPPQRPNVFRAWLGRITRNHALTRYRKYNADKRGGGQTALALEELSYCVSGNDDPETQLDSLAVVNVINRFLGELSKEQRGMFMRRYWHLASVKEIAKAYGVREGQVTSTLSRCRKKLRNMLEEEGIAL